MKPTISIVAPVYNEEDVLPELARRVREVMEENALLSEELELLRQGQEQEEEEPAWEGARRVQSEVDDLLRMYEASTPRRRSRRSAPPREELPRYGGGPERSALMKKMMMFMMMAELV